MKKNLIIVLGMAVLFLGGSFSKQPGAEFTWLDGNWKGLKYQSNADRAWQTELIINTASGTFEVSYPELTCVGKLSLVSMTENRAVFVEHIDNGLCLSEGYLIITLVDEQRISLTCLRDNRQRLASFSTLEKVVEPNP